MKVTARISTFLFRPLTSSDADTDFVLSLRNNPRFAPWFYNIITRETHLKFLERVAQADDILWIIEQDHGEPVGISSIYHFDWPNKRAECGRIACTNPKAFNMNFTVCAHLMFEHIGLNKAWIETMQDNRIIARGVERLGMTREALFRDHVFINNQPKNVLYYGITAHDWLEKGEKQRQFARHGPAEILNIER
jgi:RimJ/RimL family protein N-acetyltransferase